MMNVNRTDFGPEMVTQLLAAMQFLSKGKRCTKRINADRLMASWKGSAHELPASKVPERYDVLLRVAYRGRRIEFYAFQGCALAAIGNQPICFFPLKGDPYEFDLPKLPELRKTPVSQPRARYAAAP